MGRTCCVRLCDSALHVGYGISYFGFPKNKDLLDQWIDIIPFRKAYSSLSSICSRHFKPEDITFHKSKSLLKPDAAPSIFPDSPDWGKTTTLKEPSGWTKTATSNEPSTFYEIAITNEPSDLDQPAIDKVCRICLVMGVELVNLSEQGLQSMYELITSDVNCTEDKLPQTICSKCVDRLFSAHRLRKMALKTKEILLHKFYLSGKTITIRDIKPISEEMEKERCEFQYALPRSDTISEFNDTQEGSSRQIKREPEVNTDSSKVLVKELRIEFSKRVKNDDSLHELVISENEAAIDGDMAEEKNEADKVYYEFHEEPNNDTDNDDANDDKNNDIKVKIEHINGTSENDVNKTPKRESKRHKKKGSSRNEIEGFTVTKLSFEEQVSEIEKRKDLEIYKLAPFKCKICYKGYYTKKDYKNHMIVHDEKCSGKYECSVCKLRYKKKMDLSCHLSGAHYWRFQCKLCPFVSRHRGSAGAHRKFHEGRTYKCSQCDAEYSKYSSYMSHIRLKHVCDYVCELCGYAYISAHGLRMHKNIKHKNSENIELKGPYCDVCQVKFLSLEVYTLHLKVTSKHTTDNDPTRYRNEPVMSTRNKAIVCEECGEKIIGVREYVKHCRIQHFGRMKEMKKQFSNNIICEHCGRMFTCKSLLQDHLLVHTGESRFECDVCGKAFPNKQKITLHVKSHSHAYKCTLCDRTFNFETNRNRHILTHKLNKAYECEYCGKFYKSTATKKAHVEHVHKQKPWPKRNKRAKDEPKRLPDDDRLADFTHYSADLPTPDLRTPKSLSY